MPAILRLLQLLQCHPAPTWRFLPLLSALLLSTLACCQRAPASAPCHHDETPGSGLSLLCHLLPGLLALCSLPAIITKGHAGQEDSAGRGADTLPMPLLLAGPMRAVWQASCTADLAFLWRPMAAFIICVQVIRAAPGLPSAPAEVLLALLVGVGLGWLRKKEATQALQAQLAAMTEVAHDLVPSHVATALADLSAARRSQSQKSDGGPGTPSRGALSATGSFNGSHSPNAGAESPMRRRSLMLDAGRTRSAEALNVKWQRRSLDLGGCARAHASDVCARAASPATAPLAISAPSLLHDWLHAAASSMHSLGGDTPDQASSSGPLSPHCAPPQDAFQRTVTATDLLEHRPAAGRLPKEATLLPIRPDPWNFAAAAAGRKCASATLLPAVGGGGGAAAAAVVPGGLRRRHSSECGGAPCAACNRRRCISVAGVKVTVSEDRVPDALLSSVEFNPGLQAMAPQQQASDIGSPIDPFARFSLGPSVEHEAHEPEGEDGWPYDVPGEEEELVSLLDEEPVSLLNEEPLLAFSHCAVTVLFADIVGFTTLSKNLAPLQVFKFLNELYARYDAVVDRFRVYKVETIGDCYMCATGLLKDDPDHAAQMVRFAQEMQRQAAQVLMPDGSGLPVRVRIGIHSGPLLSGVIGRIRKRYCVVGSTVNLASRMETTGVPGRVHVSADAHALVHHLGDEFRWECRGEVGVKGVGPMVTYLLQQQELEAPEQPGWECRGWE